MLSQMTQVLYFASAPFYVEEKFSTKMFMESPMGDRNIIDIQIEKYKQIEPYNYIGRHVILVYDTCTVTRWYDVGRVTALKINTCSSWLFLLSHM